MPSPPPPKAVILPAPAATTTTTNPPATTTTSTTNPPATTTTTVQPAPQPDPDPSTLSVRVVDNHLVDSRGNELRLLGVNRPGMDALQPNGQCWTLPASRAEVDAMAAWRINAVRIPLNQDCWLGINGANPTRATTYQEGLHAYVDLLHQRGFYAILDLHRSAPGTLPATAMQAMPDLDHSPDFWSSVASSFLTDPAVVFDLYNEPHLADVLPVGSNYWACWLSGCTIDVVYSVVAGRQQQSSLTWQAAGMQQLVDAVRATGAKQPIMLSGLNYAKNLSPLPNDPRAGWLTYTPTDSANQLIASVHVYDEGVGCVNLACWNQQYAAVAREYPVVTGEFGEADCAHGFMDQYMQFADANGISYLGWSWSLETNCATQGGMALITDWNGTPSSSGVGLRDHLTALAG